MRLIANVIIILVLVSMSLPGLADLRASQHMEKLSVLAEAGNNDQFLQYVSKHNLIQVTDRDGHTPLHAALFGDVKLADAMLSQGADLEHRDVNGWTPLISAASLGYPEGVKLLLSRGAQINARSSSGETALMMSLMVLASKSLPNAPPVSTYHQHNRDADTIRLLIENKADVNIKSNSGATALLYSIFSRDPQICKLLLDAGADINHRLPNGVSMLQFARKNSSPEIVKLLKNYRDDN